MSITLTSPVVSVTWLKENLEANNLIILDGTIAKPFSEETPSVPKARFFDIKQKFSDTSDPFPSAFPEIEQFEAEARNLGVNTNSAIVVYDDKGIYSSARVWWLFKAFGYTNVAILDGGLPAWKAAGYATDFMTLYSGSKGDFKADLQPNYMLFFDDMEKAVAEGTHTIVDARSSARFNCEVSEPRAGLRRGTIPNSTNLPYTAILEDGKLKSKKEIAKALYMVAAPDDTIVFSCGSGITACVLALGAELSGYKNVQVYDGSWTEYGALTHGDMANPKTWTKTELLAYTLIYVAYSDGNVVWKEQEYLFKRVDKMVYERVLKQFETDNDYQSIQHIITAMEANNYGKNDLEALFADIKLMAFADGNFADLEQVVYTRLKTIVA